MRVFFDTSAFYALASQTDIHHQAAKAFYEEAFVNTEEIQFVTSSYILVESFALIQNRLGFSVLKKFAQSIQGFVNIIWVGQEEHEFAWKFLLTRKDKNVSFVDCVSFILMKREGISTAFSFDSDFKIEGFKLVPEQS